jgi:U2-associated protein SR140
LPGNITEETLGLFFAKIGPIGTVKVMWRESDQYYSTDLLARGDEAEPSIGGTLTATRRAKAGLQGFVSFMKRKDAEKGVTELDGIEWGGSVLRVGWSKPVPVPARAIYGEYIFGPY